MYTRFFQNHVTYHTSNTPIIISWWSWWESHPCLKSYWTTISPSYLRVPIQLYLGASELPLRLLWKEEPCENPCTSTSRILGLRTSHESSSPLWKVQSSGFSTWLQPSHTHIVPQSHWRGCYPRVLVNEPLPYLWPTTTTNSDVWFFYYIAKNITNTKYHNSIIALRAKKLTISVK